MAGAAPPPSRQQIRARQAVLRDRRDRHADPDRDRLPRLPQRAQGPLLRELRQRPELDHRRGEPAQHQLLPGPDRRRGRGQRHRPAADDRRRHGHLAGPARPRRGPRRPRRDRGRPGADRPLLRAPPRRDRGHRRPGRRSSAASSPSEATERDLHADEGPLGQRHPLRPRPRPDRAGARPTRRSSSTTACPTASSFPTRGRASPTTSIPSGRETPSPAPPARSGSDRATPTARTTARRTALGLVDGGSPCSPRAPPWRTAAP